MRPTNGIVFYRNLYNNKTNDIINKQFLINLLLATFVVVIASCQSDTTNVSNTSSKISHQTNLFIIILVQINITDP